MACGAEDQPCCYGTGCSGAVAVCWPETPDWICHSLSVDDPEIRPGFPKEIPPGWPVIVADDVDGVPGSEILLSTADGRLLAIKGDGSSPPGWPITLPTAPVPPAFATARLSAGAPGSSIVATLSPYGLAAYAGDGTALAGWPRLEDGFQIPTFADLDGDRSAELIGCGTVTLFAYRTASPAPGACGGWTPGWPKPIPVPGSRVLGVGQLGGLAASSHASIGDLDGDGIPEIVFIAGDINCGVDPTWCRALYAFHANGTPMPGLDPLILHGNSSFEGSADWPVIGDVDGDGEVEIVAPPGAEPNVFGRNLVIFVVSPRGAASGHPIKYSIPLDEEVSTPPILVDLDGDAIPEIVVQNTRQLQAWSVAGGTLSVPTGFPVSFGPLLYGNIAPAQLRNSIPVSGDLDGDGRPEIVVMTAINGSGNPYGQVLAYHADGAPMAGFPKRLPLGALSVAAIADLDGDGRNELIVRSALGGPGSDLLWVYDLNHSGPTAPAQWGQLGATAGHTFAYAGLDVPDAGAAIVPPPPVTMCNDVDGGACSPACPDGQVCMGASTFPACRSCGGYAEHCCGDCSCRGGASCVSVDQQRLLSVDSHLSSCCYSCACHDNGQSCSQDSDCCSNLCVGSVCQCAPRGAIVPSPLVKDRRDPCCNGAYPGVDLCQATCL